MCHVAHLASISLSEEIDRAENLIRSCQPLMVDRMLGREGKFGLPRYLTAHQGMVWGLRKKGFSQTEIASSLGVSRQAIHKSMTKANNKVLDALLDAARTNRLDVEKVDPAKGILLGYSQGFRSRVFLTFSPKSGVQLWYEHQGQCEGCKRRIECTERLLEIAEEWEVDLAEEHTELPPTLLAEKLFSGVAGAE